MTPPAPRRPLPAALTTYLTTVLVAAMLALAPLGGAHAAGPAEETEAAPYAFIAVGAGIGLALLVAVFLAARRQGRRADQQAREGGSATDGPLG